MPAHELALALVAAAAVVVLGLVIRRRRRRTSRGDRVNVKVHVTKPPVTTLWADSSVEMKLAKIAAGEAIQDDERDRLQEIAALIQRAVQSERLVCPIGDQDEEVQVGRRLVEETRGLTIFGMNRPHFRRRDKIVSAQLERAIRAYLAGADQVECPWSDGIEDPSQRERRDMLVPLLQRHVDADPVDMEHVRRVRGRGLDGMESIRLRNRGEGRTFARQLAVEQDMERILESVRGVAPDPPPGSTPLDEAVKPLPLVHRIRTAWRRAAGADPSDDEFAAFIRSSYYVLMPENFITCHLYADLLTGARAIRPGDGMDVEQLSAVIPYSSIVIADGDMTDRLARLGIGERFETTILSARKRDFAQLKAVLSAV